MNLRKISQGFPDVFREKKMCNIIFRVLKDISRQSPLFWLSEHNGKMMWLLELQTKNFLLLTHGPIVIYFFQLQGNIGAKMLDLILFFQNYSFLPERENSVDILCKMCQRCDLALETSPTAVHWEQNCTTSLSYLAKMSKF